MTMIDGFQITVPDTWFEVEVAPATRDAAINTLVYERTRGNPDLRAIRPQIVRLLRDFAQQAWESNAKYCACFVTPTAEGPITGSVTVSLIDAPPGDSDSPAFDRALTYLSRMPAVGSTTSPRTVGSAEIEGIGLVARTHGIEDIQIPDGRVITAVLMQTFVPLPISNQMLLVSGSSPVLWLEEQLLDLFDAVTSTLRLVSS